MKNNKKEKLITIPEEIMRLALAGNPETQFELASLYANESKRGDYSHKAMYWYTKAAEQGHAEAQYKLADLLGNLWTWNGDVESFDIAVVADLLKKAAEQGHAEAQIDLGFYYYYTHDNTLALEWWMKSANQGNVTSQHALGECYETGDIADKDIAIAIEWYKNSAAQGDRKSQEALNRLMDK